MLEPFFCSKSVFSSTALASCPLNTFLKANSFLAEYGIGVSAETSINATELDCWMCMKYRR